MSDAYDLRRFVVAQQDVYDSVVSELRAGRKTSHWMWFIFPQIAGLGRSAAAQKYAIASLAEAESYLAHPLLGPRLLDCARILTELSGLSAGEVFGAVDAQKLQSSMTCSHASRRSHRRSARCWPSKRQLSCVRSSPHAARGYDPPTPRSGVLVRPALGLVRPPASIEADTLAAKFLLNARRTVR